MSYKVWVYCYFSTLSFQKQFKLNSVDVKLNLHFIDMPAQKFCSNKC